MAHVPKLLKVLLTEAAPPDLEIAYPPMVCGIMAYVGGKPFAFLSDVGLALKLADRERDAMLTLPGAAPLHYAPDQRPTTS